MLRQPAAPSLGFLIPRPERWFMCAQDHNKSIAQKGTTVPGTRPGNSSSYGTSYTIGTMFSGRAKTPSCTTRSFLWPSVNFTQRTLALMEDSKSCSIRGQDDVSQEFLFLMIWLNPGIDKCRELLRRTEGLHIP